MKQLCLFQVAGAQGLNIRVIRSYIRLICITYLGKSCTGEFSSSIFTRKPLPGSSCIHFWILKKNFSITLNYLRLYRRFSSPTLLKSILSVVRFRLSNTNFSSSRFFLPYPFLNKPFSFFYTGSSQISSSILAISLYKVGSVSLKARWQFSTLLFSAYFFGYPAIPAILWTRSLVYV